VALPYLEEILRFPMLGRREEFMLAKCWREQGCTELFSGRATMDPRRVNNGDANRRPLMARNLATDLHHLAGIDAPVKVDQPNPQAGLPPSAGGSCGSLDFRGFGIAQHLPLSGARDNIVPLEHPATDGRKGSLSPNGHRPAPPRCQFEKTRFR
jgi:hypothetical protein